MRTAVLSVFNTASDKVCRVSYKQGYLAICLIGVVGVVIALAKEKRPHWQTRLTECLLRSALLLASIRYRDRQPSLPAKKSGRTIRKIRVNSSQIIFGGSTKLTSGINIENCPTIKDILQKCIPGSNFNIKHIESGQKYHQHAYIKTQTGKLTTQLTEESEEGNRHSGEISADDDALGKLWGLFCENEDKKTIENLPKTYPRADIYSYDPYVKSVDIKDRTLLIKVSENCVCHQSHTFRSSGRLLGAVVRGKQVIAIIINHDNQIIEMMDKYSIKKYEDAFLRVINTASAQ